LNFKENIALKKTAYRQSFRLAGHVVLIVQNAVTILDIGFPSGGQFNVQAVDGKHQSHLERYSSGARFRSRSGFGLFT